MTSEQAGAQYERPTIADAEELLTRAREAGCGVCITGGGAVAEEAVAAPAEKPGTLSPQ